MMKTWHKIAIAVIVIFGILICVKSCVDKKNPDLTLAYIGDGLVNRQAFENNAHTLNDSVGDINSDGDVHVDMMEISFSDQLSQADRQNSSMKLANAVGAGIARVYFIEEKYVRSNAGIGVFADLSALGEGFKNPDGEVVAISIKDNKKAEALGINTKGDIYLAVRLVSEIDTIADESIDKKHEAAMNVAKYILS